MAHSPPKLRFDRATPTLPGIVAVGQHRALFDDLYAHILTRSWPRFFVLVAGTFLLANAVFALGYRLDPGGVVNARPGSFEDAFYFSVQTMGTIGYGGMYPVSRAAHIMVTLEALTGILFVALVTGVTFAKFARPHARVLFCKKAVISPRDGVPHLMVRMANWRRNYVVEAQLRVIVLITERTAEGEVIRVPIDIPLVRDRTSVFMLSWTAMHRIDERSPFYGTPDEVRARLRSCDGEIYLTLSGLDETFAQSIHARYRYVLDDLVWNVRFADVLSVTPQGSRQIDYTRFHDVVPIDPAGAARVATGQPDASPPA